MADDIFVAVESVLTQVDGENVYITAGQTARVGHPILVGREALFEPFKVDYELGVEATEPVPENKQLAEAGDEAPKGNASLQEWQAYAFAHGLTAEELEPLTRDQIRDHFSQPG